MAQTRTARRRRSAAPSPWLRLLRGLGVAVVTTLLGVAVFALLMQWIKPSEGTVRIFNQVLKLAAITAGVLVAVVWAAVGRGGDGGLIRGAAVGLMYMAAGVALYALFSGQSAPVTAYLADLGMGVAGGGIVGLILSNISPK